MNTQKILFCLAMFAAFGSPVFSQTVANLETTADSLADNKNYTAAVAKYSEALDKVKNDKVKSSSLYEKRGDSYHELGKYSEALADATNAIKLNEKNRGAYWTRALANEELKRFELAIKDYMTAMPLYKDNPENLSSLYKNVGYNKYKLGLFNEEIKYDSIAIAINPKNGNAYWNRGGAYEKLNQYQKAIDDYKNAVLYQDDKIEAAKLYANMAGNYSQLKQFSAAAEQESTAISLNPDNGAYYWDRGAYYQNNKDYQFSIDDFNKAITFYKDKPGALGILYNNKAYSEMSLNNLPAALKDNTMAIELNPAYKFAYWTKGMVLANNGDHYEASISFKKAAELYKDQPKQLATLYNAYVSEEYFKANADTLLKHSTMAISLDTTNYSAYYIRGKIYLKKLKLNRPAIKDFNKVIQLDTAKASTSAIFAHYYRGDTQFAIKALKDVILAAKSDAELSVAYYNMACLYSLTQNNADALTYLQSAITKGYNKNFAANDDDFDNIRSNTEFKRLVSP